MPRKKGTVTRARRAGPDHQVVTVVGGDGGYCKKPCATCPWRKDAVGEFPAKAFVHSANTAYDLSSHTFACHSTGTETPAICAGFLLKGSYHNMAIRFALMKGTIKVEDVTDGGVKLFESYRDMAIANGVSPRNPALRPCRE